VLGAIKAIGITAASLACFASVPGNPIDVEHRANQCDHRTQTVHVLDSDYHVSGWLCGPKKNSSVQLLVHGFSYDSKYWFGLGFKKNSYVRAAKLAGVTTFAIDELGSGGSDHPDPNLFQFPQAADVVHQIVTKLKTQYDKVIGVGHSMGSATLELEAATYNDLDALVMTDGTQQGNPDGSNAVKATVIQANTLPQFSSLPANYLTNLPRSVYYDTSIADPKIINADTKYTQTGTLGMILTLASVRVPANSQAITIPVLEAVGTSDILDCNPAIGLNCATGQDIVNREKPLFSNAPCFSAFVIPGGHDTALHPDAPKMFSHILRWTKAAMKDECIA